ncbi:putative N6-adenine methyltransferase [Nitrospirillum amazonense]|uniref:Putative N6-adenine methyltransferase n=1 Tax=Nitrospirillum amazonense TaxID=28077 RepID=A0A560ESP9_9PROT|nr:putative N6-adenine methyltransferase [Nitrospirillum amazonense]
MKACLPTWFTLDVAEADRFVTPDFTLGQFFYSAETVRLLADCLDHFTNPCCLCTPRLAYEWHQRGREVRLLDYDRRFSSMPGYRPFDLLRPQPTTERFDAVIFDPIFSDATRLRRALEMVAGQPDADTPTALYMTFPKEREAELLSAFGAWRLAPLPFRLGYNNVRPGHADTFQLYGNRPLPSPYPAVTDKADDANRAAMNRATSAQTSGSAERVKK